jgi:precorrin-6B methylase 1
VSSFAVISEYLSKGDRVLEIQSSASKIIFMRLKSYFPDIDLISLHGDSVDALFDELSHRIETRTKEGA